VAEPAGRPGAIDVLGIGNALVDVLSHASDALVAGRGLAKGTMCLVDEADARDLYDSMGPGVQISGGSAANTIVGVASFGARAHYVGKVRNDQLGEVFAHDLRSTGVGFDTPPATAGPATGRCLILITPDAQRTMSTFLGASTGLTPGDIDARLIARAKIVYLEGYLFDPPEAQEAFRAAARMAHAAGGKVSLTLSDPFCVDRHREAFLDLLEHHVDILFANEAEICSLYQVGDFDAALQAVRRRPRVPPARAGARLGDRGDEVHVIDAPSGAWSTPQGGDLYAAGFLSVWAGPGSRRVRPTRSLAAAGSSRISGHAPRRARGAPLGQLPLLTSPGAGTRVGNAFASLNSFRPREAAPWPT
jgi:sugar/nucleoside kinase (ribokinase family)